MRYRYLAALTIGLSAPAIAEVESADENGFVISVAATIAASPDNIYAALASPSRWWDAAHGYSGDAANFSIDPVAGGCFCEKAPKLGGSVEHARVVMALPGKLLRLSGALGPLQAMGVVGALSWELKPAADGKGTRLVQRYAVGGHIPGGAKVIAGPVDRVLSAQFARLITYVETGKPN